jgi:predicted nucleotide-binding protein
MDKPLKQVFISYSQKDSNTAKQIYHELREHDLNIWIDVEQIAPGDHIASEISKGLTASDYYVLLISENSKVSRWVQRELSLAFKLSQKTKLTIVPLLLQNVEVPFELQGLLYIDFRKSVAEGIDKLVDFFKSQFLRVDEIDHRVSVRKSISDEETDEGLAKIYCERCALAILGFT